MLYICLLVVENEVCEFFSARGAEFLVRHLQVHDIYARQVDHCCVCVSFPSILVTVPPITARRVLHFAAYFFYFSAPKPTEVAQDGENGGFFFSCMSLMPHLLLQCLPPYLIASRVQPSLPSSTVKSNTEYFIHAERYISMTRGAGRNNNNQALVPVMHTSCNTNEARTGATRSPAYEHAAKHFYKLF